MCNTQMDSFVPFTETMVEPVLPFCQTFDCNQISAKTSMDKADSGLTSYNIPPPRKRSRDSIHDLDNAFSPVSQKNKLSGFSSFSDQDILFQLQQQQSEIDRYIAQHVSKTKRLSEEIKIEFLFPLNYSDLGCIIYRRRRWDWSLKNKERGSREC